LLYSTTVFNSPDGGVPLGRSYNFTWMSIDGRRTKWRRNIAENFNRPSRVHERYRQTTGRQADGRPMTYSEREREFTTSRSLINKLLNIANICTRGPQSLEPQGPEGP